MIRPKNETEDLLLSITKNCETLIEQIHTKPQETLEFEMTKPRETFHFNPPIQIKRDWMIGLTDLEVYNSIFNITKENNKFQLYRDSSNKFGFIELKDELEEILNNPHIADDHLEDEILGPRNIDEYIKLSHEKKNGDGYMILLLFYNRSLFRDFESYLRFVVGLDEQDIQLILKEYNSHFISYELTPGIYTIQNISDAVHTFSGHSEIKQIEYDDISMKTKILLKFKSNRQRMFGLGTLKFDERSFFHTLLGFIPYWDYKPTNAIHANSPGVQTSDKFSLSLYAINKIHLKCDCIEGSIQDGVRQPILFSFVLDKPAGYKVFSEPETIHYKRINQSVLKTITFHLEDNDHKEVDFNQETLTFTLQMIKICTNMFTYGNKSVYIYICVINDLSKLWNKQLLRRGQTPKRYSKNLWWYNPKR